MKAIVRSAIGIPIADHTMAIPIADLTMAFIV